MGEEKYFCDLCGAEFPLWPIRQWASHYIHDHNDALTVQMIGSVSQLCAAGFSQPSIQQWFGVQLLQRMAIRRRARDLGLIKWLPPTTGREN
jgi:hypothetical protein